MKKHFWIRGMSVAVVAGVLISAASSASAITIDYVPVGDAGNLVDPEISGWDPAIAGFIGSIDYDYRIGKTEVTVGQYTEFLNAKAGDADIKGLYSAGMSITKAGAVYTAISPNLPINYVSWGDAARFANWVGNGGTDGDMETGAYALGGVTDLAGLALVNRVGGSTFIASDDEWYKAAYYGGGGTWFEYATDGGTNVLSVASGPPGGSNSANYLSAVGAAVDVGSYPTAVSPYGALDMMGNVFEWTDTLVNNTGQDWTIKRGGGYADTNFGIVAKTRTGEESRTIEKVDVGFRISTITGPDCIIGDADCNGYVDIAGDILPAFSNFTGPGSFGRTRIQGDVHGPAEATATGDPHDGDVDVQDLLTMFGAFTGPGPDGSGLAAAEAGDANIPDLIYDAATGQVTLDVDGSGIIGYVLKNGPNDFAFGSHLQILAGVKTSVAGELSEAAFASSVGANSIGNVFPTGMNLAALTAYLTVNDVSRSLGAPVVPFDLVVLSTGPAVPEPATILLSVFGLIGLGFITYRRRRAA